MSAFSRGFAGFLHQRTFRLPSSVRVVLLSNQLQPISSRTSTRFFSSSTLRQHVAPIGRLPAAARPQSFISSDPNIRSVLATKQPVLLYKAPGRRVYMVGVYGLACSLVAGGLFTMKFGNELDHANLPFFVSPTYFVVAIIMLSIAGYIFSAPVSRCTSIELIPRAVGTGVQLRIKARTVPFFKDKIIIANMGEVTINEKTWPVTRELIEADRARKQVITEGLRGVFIVRRMGEVAARFVDQKWTSFFLRFKFAVLRFGIVQMNVHGDRWKIDCDGYLRENGQAIDRLIPQE